MDVYDWQKRLADTFHTNGIVGADLLPIMRAENDFGTAVEHEFKGFAMLSASFQSFLLETIRTAEEGAAHVRGSQSYDWYEPVLLSFVGMFHLIRAADRLFRTGHPLNGYGLIRDAKDRAFAYAAVLNGIVTFEQVNGWDAARVAPPQVFRTEHARAMVRARKEVDRQILCSTIGRTSGFDDATRTELFRWNDQFHAEVHGGRLTFALQGGGWLQGNGRLPLVPNVDDQALPIAMFINRFEEVAWLTLRCLCYLQSAERRFSANWGEKWCVLDDSFRILLDEAVSAGRVTASEFLQLVTTKFAFTPDSTFYVERPIPPAV